MVDDILKLRKSQPIEQENVFGKFRIKSGLCLSVISFKTYVEKLLSFL